LEALRVRKECGTAGRVASNAVLLSLALLMAALPSVSGAVETELNPCALLDNDDLERAIGRLDDFHPQHPGGTSGLRVCTWVAESHNNGIHFISVSVFAKERAAYAKRQARGEPVAGLAPGALYDRPTNTLWFDCRSGRVCSIEARTPSETNREQIAVELARALLKRMPQS
jgi:hypothetical protein